MPVIPGLGCTRERTCPSSCSVLCLIWSSCVERLSYSESNSVKESARPSFSAVYCRREGEGNMGKGEGEERREGEGEG